MLNKRSHFINTSESLFKDKFIVNDNNHTPVFVLCQSNEKEMNEENKSNSSSPQSVPREKLVNTAAKFLQNPRVRQSPLAQQRSFLEKKGLTVQEIDLAIERSGLTNDDSLLLPKSIEPIKPLPVTEKHSSWRTILTGLAAIGVFSFGFYKIFKIFLSPYLERKKKEEEKLVKLDQSIHEMTESLKQSLEQIQQTLKSMQENGQGTVFVGELKSELNCIKGLMLNRRHFPPTPSSGIPSWQLESTASKLPLSTNSSMISTEIVGSSDISPASSTSPSSIKEKETVGFEASPPDSESPEKKGSDEDTEVISHSDIPENHTDSNT